MTGLPPTSGLGVTLIGRRFRVMGKPPATSATESLPSWPLGGETADPSRAYYSCMALDSVRVLALTLPSGFAHARAVTFTEIVRDHQDEVFGLALRILGDRDTALDVTSATFLKAYRAMGRYDASRPVRHWLLRIASNEAISAGRARSRERSRRAPEDAALALPDPDADPASDAVRGEDRERIRGAVASLPERYRVPVVLRYFNDLDLQEIAAVTGRPTSTIGVQLMRGRALLREVLERRP